MLNVQSSPIASEIIHRDNHREPQSSIIAAASSSLVTTRGSLLTGHSQLLQDAQQLVQSTQSQLTNNTVYYTAGTSVPNQITAEQTDSPGIRHITVINDESSTEDLLTHGEDGDIDHDRIVFDELDHKPPYLPSPYNYSGFGRSSLRQTIISRQSARLLPPQDHVVERMEEQMVRWSAPQSSFRVDDILNGRHSFQNAELPVLEVHSRVPESTMDETTTTSQTSISAGTPQAGTQTTGRSLFVEYFALYDEQINEQEQEVITLADTQYATSALESECSIQDSSKFNVHKESSAQLPTIEEPLQPQFQFNSASFSSSMYARINGVSPTDSTERTQANQEQLPGAPTPEALPLNDDDLALFVKSQPALEQQHQPSVRGPRVHIPPTLEYRIPSAEMEDVGCWALFKEAMDDMWNDFVDVLTCNLDLSDTEYYAR